MKSRNYNFSTFGRGLVISAASLFLAILLLFPYKVFAKQVLTKDQEFTKSSSSKYNLEKSLNVAVLQVLNKITAKSSTLEAKLDNEVEFGKLSIIAHKCWQAPLDQRPESEILVEIYETNNQDIKKRIFYGWLFASSPSISGIEHPIYDVVALACK